MKITKRDQQVAADILTQFMFTKTIEEVMDVWGNIFDQYDLEPDPFTGTPCVPEEYCKNKLEYKKQTMAEKYGHWDGLE